jgi:beta-lactamase superfamily II metal-dependent hydrolase
VDDVPNEPKLIFIDCGGGSVVKNGSKNNLSNPTKPSGRRLRELFKGIAQYGIFITHNHKDHDNLCETIMKVGNESGCNVPLLCRPISVEDFEEGDENLLREKEEDFHEIFPEIEHSLGPRVRVVPMRPKVWKNNKAQNPEHDFNIMYLVEFGGRRIFFPGDVSPQLLTQMMNIPRYGREIAAVDFLVLPHHGSNRSGELLTFFIKEPELCMICSDPQEKDHLPCEEVKEFSFSGGRDITVREHSMSTADGSEQTGLPIFVTCDTAQGYYELIIEADGRTNLFDGPTARSRGDFCFQSL